MSHLIHAPEMLRTLFAGLATLVLAELMVAQPPALAWERCYGGSGIDGGSMLLPSSNGEMVFAGSTNSSNGDLSGPGAGQSDGWFLRLSADGEIVQNDRYGGATYESLNGLVELPNGEAMVCGYQGSTTSVFDTDLWVFRTDANGEVVWESAFGGSDLEWAQQMHVLPDGTIFILGSTDSADGDVSEAFGEADIWLVKLSADGELIWERSLGGSDIDSGSAMWPTDDGGFLIAGSTRSSDGHITLNQGESDGWLVKVSGAGELEWQRTYGGSAVDVFRDLVPATDGGYVLVGQTASNNGDVSGNHGGEFDIWCLKVNDQGDVLEQRCFGGAGWDSGARIVAPPSGGYTLLGGSNQTSGDVGGNNGEFDYWLVRLNEDLGIVWEKNYGGSGGENYNYLAVLNDGSYAMLGTTNSNNGDVSGNHGGFGDAWLAVTEPEAVSVRELGGSFPFMTYVDAQADQLVVRYEVEHGQRVSLQIHSSFGTLVAQRTEGVQGAGPVQHLVPLNRLALGPYLISLTMGGQRYTRRFIR